MCGSRTSYCIVILTIVFLLHVENANGRARKPSGSDSQSAKVAHLVDLARMELQTAGVSEKEIELRLKVIENAATVNAYYPHANGGRPETRNPKYWVQNGDGSYVPRENPTESIKDLWHSIS